MHFVFLPPTQPESAVSSFRNILILYLFAAVAQKTVVSRDILGTAIASIAVSGQVGQSNRANAALCIITGCVADGLPDRLCDPISPSENHQDFHSS